MSKRPTHLRDCKECGAQFQPTAPANDFCPACVVGRQRRRALEYRAARRQEKLDDAVSHVKDLSGRVRAEGLRTLERPPPLGSDLYELQRQLAKAERRLAMYGLTADAGDAGDGEE